MQHLRCYGIPWALYALCIIYITLESTGNDSDGPPKDSEFEPLWVSPIPNKSAWPISHRASTHQQLQTTKTGQWKSYVLGLRLPVVLHCVHLGLLDDLIEWERVTPQYSSLISHQLGGEGTRNRLKMIWRNNGMW